MASITRRSRSNGERRAQVEAQLLETAVRLLAEGESFTELVVQRIAADAGVAKSSFYLHFPVKPARLLTELRGRTFALVSAWQRNKTAGDYEALLALYRDILAVYRENRVLLTAITEVSAYDPAVRAAWAEHQARFAETRRTAWPPPTSTRSPPPA